MDDTDLRDTLMRFLSFRPESSKTVLSLFSELDGAIAQCGSSKNNFVYIPGTREDRVLLIAHADTVWDEFYFSEKYPAYGREIAEKLHDMEHTPFFDGKFIFQNGSDDWGLGADDRAGCAMLWLLRNSGHSLLITDGEEHGQRGSYHLMKNYKKLAEELNAHRYMIQLDRRGSSDYKTYDLAVSSEFCHYIETHTGFRDAGSYSCTDIVALCRKICGVNLSVGYYNEHTWKEYLSYPEWLNTYNIVNDLLKGEQPYFPLESQAA